MPDPAEQPRHLKPFESLPNPPTPEELATPLRRWQLALRNLAQAFQANRDDGFMTEADRDTFNDLVRPALSRTVNSPPMAATVYDDADHLLLHILASAHATQMTAFDLETIPKRSEDAQAAFLEVQRAASELINTYEAIAKRISAKIQT